MAVTFIGPDFVVPPKVRERFNDRAVLFVDDHGIEPARARGYAVAAE